MRTIWLVLVAVLMTVIACENGTTKKPGPDTTGVTDVDQTAGDDLLNDDGQLINDDGQLVNDDGQLINDDGQLVNDDGEMVTDDDQIVPDKEWPDKELPDGDTPSKICGTNAECKDGEYCAKETGACDTGGAQLAGTCEARPSEEECMIYSAIIYVCGCDGNTYQHPCFAQAAGVNIAYEGECGTVATCKTDIDCGDFVAMFCQKATGVCDNGFGICVLPQGECPGIYAPVCGCDGNTYGNECDAHSNWVNVFYEGECSGEEKYSTLYYSYDANANEPPMASVVLVDGETTVTFDGAEIMTRTPFTGGVTLDTVFFGPDGGGVVELHLTLYSSGFSLPHTLMLGDGENYAQWTNFYGTGPTQLLGYLQGEVTITKYQRDNSGTLILVEIGGDGLTFTKLPPQ